MLKGVILGGGAGSRLMPLTKITNKHLLPIYDRPMIYYPLEALAGAGIEEALLVTGGHHAGDYLRLLGNGKQFGFRQLQYTYQEGEGGIAAALSLAEEFADGQPICVILGDNVIEGSLANHAAAFRAQGQGARLLLKEVADPERFGVAELCSGKIVGIEEKPPRPKSNLAMTGIYFFDASVFDKIRRLSPSGRGEFEITDVNNAYIAEGTLHFSVLEGWWTDAGTFESLFRANALVALSKGIQVPEEGLYVAGGVR